MNKVIKKNIIFSLLMIIIILLVFNKNLFRLNKKSSKNFNINENTKGSLLSSLKKTKSISEEKEKYNQDLIIINNQQEWNQKQSFILGITDNKEGITNIEKILRSYYENINSYDSDIVKIFEDNNQICHEKISKNNENIKEIKNKISYLDKKITITGIEKKILNEQIQNQKQELSNKKQELLELKQFSFKMNILDGMKEELYRLGENKEKIITNLLKQTKTRRELIKEKKKLEKDNVINKKKQEKIQKFLQLIGLIKEKNIENFNNILLNTYQLNL
ncbi:hypothetical protein AXA84_0414 [Candidatus Phytoplasma oryzae]|uniref:Uncharacterized protein n=1 Tax=Candidatus Phytoplasma oryzae TaxID=203274 RepID=A0A139JPZ8_9MOLU|nr:hypothetical protein [Candidatus Phytoplasma oryzae]KXT29029.1 hypothetical protein AXA84_0460 [Candidatus Phytoplasma oryzae]KXT29067.1 hypothetical protein AXA84_0414 [Candidatus Phytoplasma oryzae]